jgi:hypothetical protein
LLIRICLKKPEQRATLSLTYIFFMYISASERKPFHKSRFGYLIAAYPIMVSDISIPLIVGDFGIIAGLSLIGGSFVARESPSTE